MIGSDLGREGEEKLAALQQRAEIRRALPKGVWRFHAARLLRRLAARLATLVGDRVVRADVPSWIAADPS